MNQSRIIEVLSPKSVGIQKAFVSLIGLRLSHICRVLETRYFGFGNLAVVGGSVLAEWTLIVHSPWRVERRDLIVVGQDDARIDDTYIDDTYKELIDQLKGSTLLTRRLAGILDMESDEGVVPERVNLVVTSFQADNMGTLWLGLTSEWRLSVFPAGSVGEFWRLSCLRDGWHLVADAERIYWIGESLPDYAGQ